jgi:hypothetical protein
MSSSGQDSHGVRGVLRQEPPQAASNFFSDTELIEEYFIAAGSPSSIVYVPEDHNMSNFRGGVGYTEGSRGVYAPEVFVTETLESLSRSLEARPDYSGEQASKVRSLSDDGAFLALEGRYDGLLPGFDPFAAQEISHNYSRGSEWIIDSPDSQRVTFSDDRDKVTASVKGVMVLESDEFDRYNVVENDPYRVKVF